VINWVEHVEAAGTRAYIVGAMDDELLEELVARGINCFSLHSGLPTSDFGWGSKSFHKMGREKVRLIEVFTDMGFDVAISDVDTVWLRDVREFLPACPECDMLSSTDCLTTTLADEVEDELESIDRCGGPANIGIMYFRPKANAFAREWLEMILEDDNYWDQAAFNDLFRRGPKDEKGQPGPPGWRNHESGDRSIWAYGGTLRMGLMPSSTFANGHTYYLQRMHEKHRLNAFVVHNTFQYSGTEGKRHRFREALLWDDPPEYFDDEAGFLFFHPDVPKQLLEKALPPEENRLSLEETSEFRGAPVSQGGVRAGGEGPGGRARRGGPAGEGRGGEGPGGGGGGGGGGGAWDRGRDVGRSVHSAPAPGPQS